MSLIDQTKTLFFQKIDAFGSDPYYLTDHLPEVEKWAKICLKKTGADEEITLLGVWLHDVGHYPVPTEIDHAVRGEEVAINFLREQSYPEEKIQQVAHCVRAHRCRDILPQTMEAKIVAFSDSASHMTQIDMYLSMTKKMGKEKTLEKIERDWRDLGWFPEIKEELLPLYEARKVIVTQYGIINEKYIKI